MTANDQFGSDASAFFNVLSGYSDPPVWNKLVMAPLGLRKKIYELIDNEISIVKKGGTGHIIAKMNSLIDYPVIQKLYEASMAGVKIDLIIRGICGLRAGMDGISDNITVRSIVGRQLEHSRIFWFQGGGKEQLSSPVQTGCRVTLTTALNCSSRLKRRRILNVLKKCLICTCAITSART